MLSVCIPIYNVNVNELVSALQAQAAKLDVPIEIILIDDHSNDNFMAVNKELTASIVKYVYLPENIGRARVRNKFLEFAQYENLLFLDCDSEIVRADFLARYITELKNGAKVICGGRIYSEVVPPKNIRLHWKYGRTIESQPAAIRQLEPNASFMTNNFAIAKSVFEEIKLNEKLEGYGHEDTLFGYDLEKHGIIVKHIDNPLLHAELHNNAVFMKNTESALHNLVKVCAIMQNDETLINEVRLLKTYFRLKKSGMLFFMRMGYVIEGKAIRALLAAGIANMFLYNFYKLGYLSKIMK